jgi:hypothetical protein
LILHPFAFRSGRFFDLELIFAKIKRGYRALQKAGADGGFLVIGKNNVDFFPLSMRLCVKYDISGIIANLKKRL